MKYLISLFFAILLELTLAGCATTIGTPFNDAKVPEIKEGVTTKEWVVKNIGEPAGVTREPEGEVWYYQATEGYNYLDMVKGAVGGPMKMAEMKQLKLTFNEKGVVKKIDTNLRAMSYKESLEKPAEPASPPVAATQPEPAAAAPVESQQPAVVASDSAPLAKKTKAVPRTKKTSSPPAATQM